MAKPLGKEPTVAPSSPNCSSLALNKSPWRERRPDKLADLTVTRAAQGLGGTRQALSEPVNGRTRISVEMAIRLSKAFGSTPETWLGMQDGLRPLAGPRPRRGDRGGTFCVGGELEPSRDDMA